MAELLGEPEIQAILTVVIVLPLAIAITAVITRMQKGDDTDHHRDLIGDSWWIIPGTALAMYLAGVYGTPFSL